MTLKKLYRQSVLYPTIILLVVSLLYSIVYSLNLTRSEQLEHSLEWYETIILNFLTTLLYCAVIGILALTIYFNKFKKISSNFASSALSWFLLPFVFIFLVIGKAINELITVHSSWEIIYTLTASIPFIIGLTRGFSKFRRLKLNVAENKHSS